ncbi:PhoH family protein, partial [Dubosiella newyorkensis]|uniref:PhoH family protein n=1 Tax=Dubosiella newyorkensis TaxID=1862672 RepID=UPI00272B35BF
GHFKKKGLMFLQTVKLPGKKTKMIVTGDVTQIDLIKDKDSGLIQACQILQGIPEISIVHLGNEDVVRNPLVQKIIERYANVE